MIKIKNATLQIFLESRIYIVILLLSACMSSCGLFDKEIKQDKHIAEFRYRMNRVMDSLDNHKGRIKAFEEIIERINADEDLITLRKKNILLIEGNTFISNEYLSLENYKKAIKYANIIIDIDSTSPKGFYNRGCIYQIINEDSLAILDYNKALKLNPDYSDAYYNRGIIYEELGEYDKALEDYNRAIKLNPSYIIDVYTNRGNTYLAKEAYDKAISDYGKILAIDSTNIKAYSNRAGAYIMQKEYDKALTDCNKAIGLDSTNINAYQKRASVYEAQKEYKQALDDYGKILHLDPQNKFDTHETVRKAIKKLRPLSRYK
ncbi:tetratricopeptide repeat protein [Dysgonomonas termitidis]|uniref:Tetratricopeptide repeat protein n=1 Tax=Dysgonomonas termitidis TaxID=1516126 RepID=A0ABV9KPQ2_9BACT